MFYLAIGDLTMNFVVTTGLIAAAPWLAAQGRAVRVATGHSARIPVASLDLDPRGVPGIEMAGQSRLR